MKYYSPSKCTFYDSVFKEVYISNGNWPDDLVEVGEQLYEEVVIKKPKSGYCLVTDENGKPSLKFSEELVVSEDILREISWRDRELTLADFEINKILDEDFVDSDRERSWRNYRKELRNWPDNPDFPDELKRPKQPVEKTNEIKYC